MRISDWSSDVCSSDLRAGLGRLCLQQGHQPCRRLCRAGDHTRDRRSGAHLYLFHRAAWSDGGRHSDGMAGGLPRSEEHTSELQSLMRISYAVFCLKKTTRIKTQYTRLTRTQPTVAN